MREIQATCRRRVADRRDVPFSGRHHTPIGGWRAVTQIRAGGRPYAQRIVTRPYCDLDAAKRAALESAGPGDHADNRAMWLANPGANTGEWHRTGQRARHAIRDTTHKGPCRQHGETRQLSGCCRTTRSFGRPSLPPRQASRQDRKPYPALERRWQSQRLRRIAAAPPCAKAGDHRERGESTRPGRARPGDRSRSTANGHFRHHRQDWQMFRWQTGLRTCDQGSSSGQPIPLPNR